MKVMLVNGSSRKNGCTGAALAEMVSLTRKTRKSPPILSAERAVKPGSRRAPA